MGDRLAIFYGGLTPYIIRKEINERRFIGETYAHGLMSGEAFDIAGIKEDDMLFI